MNTDPNLYPDGAFAFHVDEGAHHTDTGWHWPALLRVTMNRRDALKAMQYLLAQIADDDPPKTFELTWSGNIQRQNEDGDAIAMDGGPVDRSRCAICGARAGYITAQAGFCETHKFTPLDGEY